MIINVSQLLKEHIGSTRSYEVDGEDNFPYRGKVVLIRTDKGLLVKATLATVLGAVCSRCLCDFDQDITIDFSEEFLLQREGGDFIIDEYRQIDLSEVARQYTLLVEPMKPLCREDCSGMCPQCGMNLNLGACDCAKDIDPRMAMLASLVKDRS
ncbi:MAG: DUF177 domain-containing protein [Dehalococcoidia bacterium]|jgi:uncharacterized protein